MSYRYVVGILLVLYLTTGFSRDKKQSILQIDNYSFSRDEFRNIYEKNNSNLAEGAEIKTPSEYMDLFVNFKLKVLEAERMGLDTLSSFRKELKTYRNELAQPYLTNIKFDEEM
jgi:peptidyl-prolyl cis-trans isomerase SurA